MLQHLSLYSGIGAKDLAARWAGIKTVALCDAEPFCRSVLRKNFPGTPIFEYDTEVTREALDALGIGKVDIISGGFPCQAWSLAGKKRGEDDPRHRWPEMARIIGEVKPTWVLGENVRGLVSGGGLDAVCADLENLGYEVWPVLLPTGVAVGSPHKRERIIILARLRTADRTDTFLADPRREGQSSGGLRGGETPLGEIFDLWAGDSSQALADANSVAQPRTRGTDSGALYKGSTEPTSAGETTVRSRPGSGSQVGRTELVGDAEHNGQPTSKVTLRNNAGDDGNATGALGSEQFTRSNDLGSDIRGRKGSASGTELVGDTHSEGREGRSSLGGTGSAGRQGAVASSSGGGDTRGYGSACADEGGKDYHEDEGRITQSRLGGDVDGLPAGLDRPGYSWPAGRGEPQYEWEPPRLTFRKEQRRDRLKALGNSAVPQALYPFFRLMVEYEAQA